MRLDGRPTITFSTINAGAGNDVVFGDHGVIGQTDGTRRIETTGSMILLQTVIIANGSGDTIHGDSGNDFIFGGVAEMKEEPVNPKVEFLMAVAGPLASLVLAAAFLAIERAASAAEWPIPLIGISSYLAYVNFLLALFNLVPAFPLDGGRMLRAALWAWRANLVSATQTASRIGSGFGLALMLLGVLAFFQGQFVGGMWWLLIGAFLRSAATASSSSGMSAPRMTGQ